MNTKSPQELGSALGKTRQAKIRQIKTGDKKKQDQATQGEAGPGNTRQQDQATRPWAHMTWGPYAHGTMDT